MGTRFRLGVEGKTPLKALANLGAKLKRASNVLLPNSRESMPLDMFASNCLPYKASKTYRIMIAESECRRMEVTLELQRSLRRI